MSLKNILLVALLSAPLFSQIQTARIAGIVYDPNRAVIPGASLTLTNKNTNVAQKVASDGSGNYVISGLYPGTYDISALSPGFRTLRRNGIEIQVGKDLQLDLELSIGESSSVIEVTAELPLLNSESGAVSHVMTNQQIVDLPLNGRGFNELARLTPGVVLLPGTGNVTRIRPEFFNGTTISGVRGRQVSYFLDGADTSEQHQGGSSIQTSIDALQEFSVQQNAYSSEYSRSGSFFNATTKSGTNLVRGTLYEFLRNEKMDSRNFFAAKRDLLKRNQFGASVGGPIYLPKVYDGRNRSFFFFNYEGMRERQGNTITRSSPTPGMLLGDFSAIPNIIYDPLTTVTSPTGVTTRSVFPGNRIPSGRLSPQSAFFNSYIPTAPTPAGLYVFNPSTRLDSDQYTARIDHTISDAHKVFFRYSRNGNRLGEPGNSPLLGNADSAVRGQNYSFSLSSNLRPTLINDFRVNLLYNAINLNAFLMGRDFNKDAGIKGFEALKRASDIVLFLTLIGQATPAWRAPLSTNDPRRRTASLVNSPITLLGSTASTSSSLVPSSAPISGSAPIARPTWGFGPSTARIRKIRPAPPAQATHLQTGLLAFRPVARAAILLTPSAVVTTRGMSTFRTTIRFPAALP